MLMWPAHRTADHFRAGAEYENRQDAGHRDSAVDDGSCDRGDRM